ncbi:MAG: 2-isopropylmalate synthase [Smithellaceae bacterium]|nr:2-isopropylmalate synthase [Syntrophaceae bacterium]MDD4240833.1 2-isopropylmalate synthase [Smithellaceae bacterium]NLX51697.1 2-isopropylmalate synthase [Deltaproteobacteria bacterium]
MKKDKNRVYIFDTSLRDGEQSPGNSMNTEEKLLLARQLENLGVDIIEAGFPIASEGDFDAVRQISRVIRKSQVAGLARANKADIDRAWQAIKGAAHPRIHTFISSSDIHLKYQLKKSRAQVLDEAVAAVRLAKSCTDNVEFSPMDATRSDRDYLVQMVAAVIDAGAIAVNIPDTVGYAVPEEFGDLIAYLFANVKNIDRAILSVHCHNDLGLAVANSLAAIRAGARQVECTINGIGERAGNTAMEEIVMALATRKDLYGLYTKIKTEQIYKTSRLLTQITGIAVQPNKAIVGTNAFAHESGIHQDGLIKEKITYEIMTPKSVGISDTHIVLGKHSGRAAIAHHLKKMGYELSEEQLSRVAAKVKELADIKKDIYDEDLQAIIYEDVYRGEEKYNLIYLNVVSGNVAIPTATMEMKVGAEVVRDAGFGNGPVDATFAAIRNITKTNYPLLKYAVNAITGGSDAQGETMVQLKYNGHTVVGRGAHPDVIVASAKAYINALNRLEFLKSNVKKVKVELS